MKISHVWELDERAAKLAVKFGYADSENMVSITHDNLVMMAPDKMEAKYGTPMTVPVMALLRRPVLLQITPRTGQTGEDLHYYHSVLTNARTRSGQARDVDKAILHIHDYVVSLAFRNYLPYAKYEVVLERRSRIHRLRYSVVWIWKMWGGSSA